MYGIYANIWGFCWWWPWQTIYGIHTDPMGHTISQKNRKISQVTMAILLQPSHFLERWEVAAMFDTECHDNSHHGFLRSFLAGCILAQNTNCKAIWMFPKMGLARKNHPFHGFSMKYSPSSYWDTHIACQEVVVGRHCSLHIALGREHILCLVHLLPMRVSRDGGIQTCLVYNFIMENPIKIDDLGVPCFRKPPKKCHGCHGDCHDKNGHPSCNRNPNTMAAPKKTHHWHKL